MTKTSKKEQLFRLGETAAKKIGIVVQGYPCPICARIFDERSLKNGELSLEHVPQRSAGGKGILLTCVECNNFAGHTYEYSVKERDLLIKQANSLVSDVSGSFGRMKMKVGDVEVNVEYSVENGTKRFRILEANDPKSIEALHKSMMEFEDGSEFQVSSGHPYSSENVKRSDLKSAFLAITAKFGYSIGLNPRLAPIRDAILNRLDSQNFIRYLEKPTNNFSGILVDEPTGLAGISMSDQIVVFPWPSRPFETFAETKEIRIKGRLFPFPRSFEALVDNKEPR